MSVGAPGFEPGTSCSQNGTTTKPITTFWRPHPAPRQHQGVSQGRHTGPSRVELPSPDRENDGVNRLLKWTPRTGRCRVCWKRFPNCVTATSPEALLRGQGETRTLPRDSPLYLAQRKQHSESAYILREFKPIFGGRHRSNRSGQTPLRPCDLLARC